MNKILKYIFAVVVLVQYSCGDVLENNISNKSVLPLSPVNGARLDSSRVTFWWEALEGATAYSLTVVSPSFDSILYVLADTLVYETKLNLNFSSGAYQWGVAAINSAYATAMTMSSFTIRDSLEVNSPDISGEVIDLLSPVDGEFQNNIVTFWWEELKGVNKYQLSIVSPVFESPEMVILDSLMSTNKFVLSIPSGNYQWRVRGINGLYKTAYAVGTITVADETDTLQNISNDLIVLTSPYDNQTINSKSVVLWWETLVGADAYDVVVVTPSFDAAEKIVINQLVEDHKLQIELDSGSYQWGVRGLNSISKTDYSVRTLYVH